MNNTNNTNIKLSTSLFSFALEWNARQYDLEGLMAKVKERGLASGLEIIGFQSLRGFPHLPNETIKEVRHLIEKYEFEPACLGANVDVGIRRDRNLTFDETVEYIEHQI